MISNVGGGASKKYAVKFNLESMSERLADPGEIVTVAYSGAYGKASYVSTYGSGLIGDVPFFDEKAGSNRKLTFVMPACDVKVQIGAGDPV